MAMREYLYRAKRANGKGWLYGIPIQNCMVYHSEKMLCYNDGDMSMGETAAWRLILSYSEINRDTLGEFTGLTDKNGVKIFEGDILKYISENGKLQYFVVSWNKDPIQYIITETKTGCADVLDDFVHRKMEVTGNIFDNPELIGGEQK